MIEAHEKRTIQCRRAVSHRSRPFPNESPFVRIAVRARSVAHRLPMLPRRHRHVAVAEDLILMMVNCDVLRVIVRWGQESIVGRWVAECVLQDDRGIGGLARVQVALAVEVVNVADIEGGGKWLIEELDTNDDVLIGGLRVLRADGLQDVECLLSSGATNSAFQPPEC